MTTGATPEMAAHALRSAVQRVVACAIPDVVDDGRDAAERALFVLARVRFTDGKWRGSVQIRHRYMLVFRDDTVRREQWSARTSGYDYVLIDGQEQEILAFHWHPTGRSHVTTPHLHLGAGAGALQPQLTKAHIDTGFTTPVALLRLVIDHYGVPPRRTDWSRVLEQAGRTLRRALPAEP